MNDHQKGQNNAQEHQNYAETEEETRRVHDLLSH